MVTQKESQCKLILEHLLKYGHITPIEALDYYGCFRLSARIKDLRDRGAVIRMERIRKNGKTFACYYFEGWLHDISA